MHVLRRLYYLPILTHHPNYFSAIAIGEPVVNFRDITTATDLVSRTAVLEVDLGPLAGLSRYLTYDAALSWSQLHGNQSLTGTIHAFHPRPGFSYSYQKGRDFFMQKARNRNTYLVFVPIKDLGEGRLLVNMTINLYCISYINKRRSFYDCNCSQWQVGWVSNSLKISAKRGVYMTFRSP